MKTYFKTDYLDFFKSLAANNHKDWFDANRADYLNSVKNPFDNFVKALITETSKIDAEINITPKESIIRINRDVRFSKDKSAYKLQMSAIISKYGKKVNTYPGLYIELGPEKLGIYGGLYMPTTHELTKVREAIYNNFEVFNQLVSKDSFKNYFGEIKGIKNKRIDKIFAEKIISQPLLLNKQWYYMASLDADLIVSTQLMPIIIEHFKAMKDLNDFFKEALYK